MKMGLISSGFGTVCWACLAVGLFRFTVWGCYGLVW